MIPTPTIWLLCSYRAGENSQLRALAEAVAAATGGQLHSHDPTWATGAGLVGLLRSSGLAGLSSSGRQQLLLEHRQQPPDLVISAGLRNEPLLRWFRARGAAVVVLGRSWARPQHFDLVVTTPQYRLPDHPQVLHNSTTLHSFSAAGLADLARQQPAPANLSRPITLVLVGGDAGPYVLRRRGAMALVHRARALAGSGSLLVTTSSRTHSQANAALAAAVTPPDQLHLWQANDPDNPYARWLSWADQIVVTADSIAMLSEAVASGRPVHLFDPSTSRRREHRPSSLLYQLLQHLGPGKLSRDVGLVHQQLAARGWLTGMDPGHSAGPDRATGQAMAQSTAQAMDQAGSHRCDDPGRSALPGTVARVAALLGQRQATSPTPGTTLSANAAKPTPER